VKTQKTLMVGIAALILIAIIAIKIGAFPLTLQDILDIFKGNSDADKAYVLYHIRIPRVIGTIVVGAILALSGNTLQAIMRNDLAEPSLLGISSGAAVSTGIGILLLGAMHPFLFLFAFIGALTTTLAVQRLAQVQGRVTAQQLVLTGVAVNALCGAVIGLFSFLSTDEQLRTITFWMLGGMGGITWSTLGPLAIAFMLLFMYGTAQSKNLDLIALGDHEAHVLGASPMKIKNRMIILSSLAVGITVAICGIISFVGLIIPHVSRLLVGSKHRNSLIVSAVLGAVLLTSADLVARTIIRPAELPIGILTSLLGAPFFMALLRKTKKTDVYA
jgi:iron complex transport system permease protein